VRDVFFTDELNGWQVGQFYRLASTSDGGLSWDAADPHPDIAKSGSLNSIAFANGSASVGVAVGEADQSHSPARPKIFYFNATPPAKWVEPTSVRYASQYDADGKELRKVISSAGTDFWAAGQAGLMLHSTDSGATWSQFIPPGETAITITNFEIRGVAFVDASNGIFVGSRPINNVLQGVAYRYPDWVQIAPNDPSIVELSDVAAGQGVVYAVGVTGSDLSAHGKVFSSPLSGSVPGTFVSATPALVVDACNVGNGITEVPVLNSVKIAPGGDVWVGGQCGRIWMRSAATGIWTDPPLKTQTDAHILGMSFAPLSGGYVGYLACFRKDQTQFCIVRYN
jgi:hypothetical protein